MILWIFFCEFFASLGIIGTGFFLGRMPSLSPSIHGKIIQYPHTVLSFDGTVVTLLCQLSDFITAVVEKA